MVQLWRMLGDAVLPFLLMIAVAIIFVYFVARRQNGLSNRMIVNLFLLASMMGVLMVTVWIGGARGMPSIVNLTPLVGVYHALFHSGDLTIAMRNLVLNAFLFIPFGFFLSARLSQIKSKLWLKITVMGLFFSLIIEGIQFMVPSGRAVDIDDLLANTVGTYLGYITWAYLKSKFYRNTQAKQISEAKL